MFSKINFVSIIVKLLSATVGLAEKERNRLSKQALKHIDGIGAADRELTERKSEIIKLRTKELDDVWERSKSREASAKVDRDQTVNHHRSVLEKQGEAHDRLMAALNPVVVFEE